MISYDNWKTGANDPYFDDAPEWPPCYRDSMDYPRNTDTGRFMSEEEYAEVRDEWENGMEPEEIEAAGSQLRSDQKTRAWDKKRRAELVKK